MFVARYAFFFDIIITSQRCLTFSSRFRYSASACYYFAPPPVLIRQSF